MDTLIPAPSGTIANRRQPKVAAMNAPSAPRCTIARNTMARLKDRVGDLQMLPGVAQEALQAARDPNCALPDFAALIQRDVKLAADMLAMANSAAFSGGRVVSSLNQAILRLGFRQCRNLILSTSLASLMKKLTINDEWIRESLARHGFLTALLAVAVNQRLNLGFQGEEFVAGLIHDIGRSLLAVLEPDTFEKIDSLSYIETWHTPLHEQSACGLDHCAAGEWFVKHQELPAEFAAVAKFHHAPAEAGEHQPLTALIAVCDDMSNHLMQAGGPGGYQPNCRAALDVLVVSGADSAAVVIPRLAEQLMADALQSAGEMSVL